MYVNKETRQIVTFNQTSGDLITAEKYRKNYFNKCVESRQIGNLGNSKIFINQSHMEKKYNTSLNYSKQRHLELLKLKYSQEKVFSSEE